MSESKDCNVLVKGNVKVEWVELGEGWSGDYNEEDPNDEELLRFDVSIWLPDVDDVQGVGDWCDPGDASYCTRFPASATPEQRLKGLELIMNEVYEDATAGHRIKKICEHLSWIGLDWLDKKAGNDEE